MVSDLIRALCVVLVSGGVAVADPVTAPAPLFDADDRLILQLRGPLSRAYDQTADEDPRESPGELRYESADGERVKLTVRFRQRGNMRRRACSMPPLRLNLVKKEVVGTLFDGQDKLKLVGVCEPARDYRRYVMLEYFAYRAYALLTPYSFDTRLLELRYVDTAGGASMRRPAFLIEDVDALAARNGTRELGLTRVSQSDLDPDAAALLELFALMIGNTDFSTIRGPAGEDCCHNVKLLDGGETGIVPVPYDFDSAGIVDTPYALPSEKLPIESNRTRYFNGLCKSDDHFQRARARIREREAEILALFNDRRALGNRMRAQATRYLRDFFTMLKDDAQFERDVVAACVGSGDRG